MWKIKLHSTNDNRAFKIKNLMKKAAVIAVITTVVLNNPYFGNIEIAKASTVSVVPDYTDETVTVSAGSGLSSKFFMSTDNMKTWEEIDTGKMDISSLMSTRAVTVYFKGNKDTDANTFVIPAEDNTLKPVYKVTSGVGTIEFTSSLPVQYRKGNGSWINVASPMKTAMYETRGATLYFRTAPQVATRAGKIVNVKIPKKPAAPSVKLDGSKLNISGLKPGVTQYRVGDNLGWTLFPSVSTSNYIDLATLFGGSTANNTAIPAGVIEFYTAGDNKKANSSVRVLEVAQQAVMIPSIVAVSGSAFTVNNTDKKKTYEYTIVQGGYTLNMATARWTTLPSNRAVIIPRVAINDKVLVRVKSSFDSTTKQVILASTYAEFTITGITQRITR